MIEPGIISKSGHTLSDVFYKKMSEVTASFAVNSRNLEIYETHIRDDIGSKDICRITSDDIIRISIKLSYLGAAYNTIEILCKFLSECFRYDSYFEVKSQDPATQAINIIRGMDDRSLNYSDEQGITNLEEAKEKIIAFLDKDNDPMWKLFFLMAFGTGLSYRRLCSLRWKDIDFDKDIITSENSMCYIGGNYVLEKKKNQTARIPILNGLRDGIISCRYEIYDGKLEGLADQEALAEQFIFSNPLNSQLRYGNISTVLNSIIGEINLREYIDSYISGSKPHLLSGFYQKDIKNAFIINMYDLGYTPVRISLMIPDKNDKAIQEIISRLKRKMNVRMWRW